MPGTVAGTSYTPLVPDNMATVGSGAVPTVEKALHVPRRGQVESEHQAQYCGGVDVRVDDDEEEDAVTHPPETANREFHHQLQLDCAYVVAQLQLLLQ